MCGIVGYVGPEAASPRLLDGLRRLEYRGYDSAGLAVHDGSGLHVARSVGRLAALEARLADSPLAGSVGVGHTRWATHGAPSEANAHPHLSPDGRIAVVHNGIIENYRELREELAAAGHRFQSETDTETLPHLIQREVADGAASGLDAIAAALRKARGAYALGILLAGEPEVVYAARLGSPLIVGVGEGETYIASDVPAIVNRVRKVIYLEDGQIARLTAAGVEVFDLDGRPAPFEVKDVTVSAESADRAGFETFMLKEIHEQPRILRDLLHQHVDADGRILLPDLHLDEATLKGLDHIFAVACGTAFHAAMYGKILIEHLTSLRVDIELASEFRYRRPKVDGRTLLLAVSQSGETADTLASVRMAHSRGCRVVSICNVHDSSLVRECDGVLYTQAGPEIGVASTKAYTTQLLSFVLLALHLARLRGDLEEPEIRRRLQALRAVPNAIHYVLERKDAIERIADKHHDGPSSLYLGRRFNVPTALEGALKNKEISYQHAEGYAAGEMKHGPIALIHEYLPVVCICTRTEDEVYDKMVSNLREVEARHGRIIALATDGDRAIAEVAEDVIFVPETLEEFSPLVNVVALQLLAYFAAKARGTDIDKPRNLAKSVTVE